VTIQPTLPRSGGGLVSSPLGRFSAEIEEAMPRVRFHGSFRSLSF